MKKNLARILVVCLAIALTACGSTPAASPAPVESGSAPVAPAPSLPKQQLTLVTGSTGGTYFALGGAMATAWTKNVDHVTVSCLSSGASVENMNLLQKGEADLGMAMNSIADAAWNANAPFTAKTNNVRAIGVVYPEVIHIVATAETGANDLADLRGKRVALGPAGSGGAVFSEIAFAAAGIDATKDINAQRDSFSDATAKMQDGHLDASVSVLAVPASAIVELETSKKINFINISDEVLEAIRKDYPFYTRFKIPANTYSNTADVDTVTCQAALYCTSSLDEETVYLITKSFYENSADVAATHAAGKYINLDTALDGITTPLHKGAVRYFTEKGINVPANLIID